MKRICLILLSIMVILSLSACGGKETAAELAAYGEEQFLQNDFEEYVGNLRNSGLDDLTLECKFSYSYDGSYDKETNTLRLRCSLENFVSSTIDNYFTTDFNGSEGLKLARLMDRLKSAYEYKQYTYTLDGVGTVIVRIDRPDYEIVVNTPAGRAYEFEYGYIDSVCMTIDEDWVYSADNEEFYGSSDSNNNNNNSGNSSGNYARHTDSEAFACAKDILRSYLKSPSTAKFCSFTEAKVTHLGNGEYEVTGWVEAENSFGAKLRQNFTVTYTATSSGYKNGTASVY